MSEMTISSIVMMIQLQSIATVYWLNFG